MADKWRIKGEYLESCNCELLCPCLLGPRGARGGALARPTQGHCDVPLVFQIESGAYGPTRLDSIHAALVVHTPGVMGDGNWTAGLYLDERASAEQRQGLEAIFTGRAGGVMAVVTSFISTWLPTRVAPIRFGKEGRRRSASIPGILDVEIEGLEGRDGKSEVWLENVKHFVSPRLAAARATRSSYKDHTFVWNHTGRNSHYAAFEWTGG